MALATDTDKQGGRFVLAGNTANKEGQLDTLARRIDEQSARCVDLTRRLMRINDRLEPFNPCDDAKTPGRSESASALDNLREAVNHLELQINEYQEELERLEEINL